MAEDPDSAADGFPEQRRGSVTDRCDRVDVMPPEAMGRMVGCGSTVQDR